MQEGGSACDCLWRPERSRTNTLSLRSWVMHPLKGNCIATGSPPFSLTNTIMRVQPNDLVSFLGHGLAYDILLAATRPSIDSCSQSAASGGRPRHTTRFAPEAIRTKTL